MFEDEDDRWMPESDVDQWEANEVFQDDVLEVLAEYIDVDEPETPW
jgi:hypothetical protein